MTPEEPAPDAANLAFVEGLFADFQRDPASVPAQWRAYFQAWPETNGHASVRVEPERVLAPRVGEASLFVTDAAMQERLDMLVRSFRVRGHRIAHLDPLELPRASFPELDPAYYGFGPADLERSFSTRSFGGETTLRLREILARLHATYCRTIGVQFMHIDDLEKKMWLQERMERTQNHVRLARGEQLRILRRLTDAVVFEEFVQKKFLGAKSFSLEGCESLIPLLDLAIERAADQGIHDMVFGMAHRGRLNVLANILGKSPSRIFREFADQDPEQYRGRGDVKYHLGHTIEFTTSSGGRLSLSLCFNPSHLEFVNPVALGRTRARQDRLGDHERRKGMCVLIHGDAAFAGQGIVMESLNLSELPGYRTGGTLHVIVNNQIGFTTDPAEARSSVYCTDVAKMLQIPVFHVNGEDPEAVAQVIELAMGFRAEFQSDVVIDMYGYRRRGHNEGDEPAFTQPRLYETIRQRKSVREGYLEHLLALGGLTRAEADAIESEAKTRLERELTSAQSSDWSQRPDSLGTHWQGYAGGRDADAPEIATAVPREKLRELCEKLVELPAGFQPHAKIAGLLEARRRMARGEQPLDWAAGEALALASLAVEGVRVRLSGQDAQRGTFSHRHAVLHDVQSGRAFLPLGNLELGQAPVEVRNSPLSEPGVLGFEYGYSLDCPEGLTIWEAQFGDFNNVAQVIIDQFLVSAEEKWRRLSGLVLFLPHGFEGQGPEHSSARLERFLMQCADDNIQVVDLSTPAQLFHCLRRQVRRKLRKPLVVMSPKSLLRHPRAVSTLEELATGSFRRILPDAWKTPAGRTRARVERVLACTGKLYYEIEEQREKLGREDVAILRFEQLYPLAAAEIAAALAPYAPGTPVVWVQEEPENMGAWRHLLVRFGASIAGTHPLRGITRPAAASPATGSLAAHKLEQQEILQKAFGPLG